VYKDGGNTPGEKDEGDAPVAGYRYGGRGCRAAGIVRKAGGEGVTCGGTVSEVHRAGNG
jgi:hypothetical protein